MAIELKFIISPRNKYFKTTGTYCISDIAYDVEVGVYDGDTLLTTVDEWEQFSQEQETNKVEIYDEDETLIGSYNSLTYNQTYTLSYEVYYNNNYYHLTKEIEIIKRPSTLTASNYKTVFIEGEKFTNEATVTLTYDDNSTKTITNYNTVTGTVIEGTSVSSRIDLAETDWVFYEYEENGISVATSTHNISWIALYSLSLTTTSVKTSYYQGDTLSTTGLTATGVFKDSNDNTTTKDVTSLIVLSIDDVRISNIGKLNTIGTKTVVASLVCGETIKTNSYNITIVADSIASISVDTSEITDVECEGKFYVNRTEFTSSSVLGLVITATKLSGRTETISPSSCTYSKAFNTKFTTVGTETITVTYSSLTTSYTVSVLNESITSLTITGNPTSAYIGDIFKINGMVVVANWSNGYSEQITYGSNGYSVSGLTVGDELDLTDIGEKTVTVTYNSVSATFVVTVSRAAASELVIDYSNFSTLYKNGDTFDPSTIICKMRYVNGFEETLTYTSSSTLFSKQFKVDYSSITISNGVIAETTFGAKNLIITSNGYSGSSSDEKTKTISVAVQPNKQLLDIDIIADNAKTQYTSGETFTGEGFVIRARYQDTTEYVDIPVIQGVSVISTTNPQLGSTITKTGQLETKFSYTFLNVTKSATYIIDVVPSYSSSATTTKTLKIVKLVTLKYNGDTIQDYNDDGYIWALYNQNDTTVDANGVRNANSGATCYGYVIKGTQTSDTNITKEYAKLVLFNDYTPPVEGASNIEVTFPHYVEGYADRINHCRFGILYGNNNSRNRLFVSGNPDTGLGNMDWHSETINTSQIDNYEGIADGDLTYFSDLGYCAYGQLSNKVVGYDIIGNGTLMVLKSYSTQEPTIYYRSATQVAATSYDGNTITDSNGNSYYEDAFPLTIGNIGEGGISNKSIVNFNGDTLFLTKTGIKGLDISSAIADNQRYANNRSTYINKALLKYDLSKCSLFTHNEWLIVATPGRTFIANSNYRSNLEYEWWVFDDVGGVYYMSIDEELYFANDNGEICKFDFDSQEFVDKARVFVNKGSIMPITDIDKPVAFNEETETLVLNSDYFAKVVNGDKLSFITNYSDDILESKKKIYGKIGTFATQSYIDSTPGVTEDDFDGIIGTDSNYTITLRNTSRTEDLKKLIYNGRKVYFDNIVQTLSSGEIGVAYEIEETDIDETGQFNVQGQYDYLLKYIKKFRMSFVVEEATIDNLTYSNFVPTFELIGDHDLTIDIIRYDSQVATGYSAIITHNKPIKAYYMTKPFNFGTNIYVKNIYKWSIVNDTSIASVQNIGYIVDNTQASYEMLTSGLTGANMNFEQFSFNTFTFTSNIMPTTFTTRKRLEKVKYISFIIMNEENQNCVLTNISMEYTIGVVND